VRILCKYAMWAIIAAGIANILNRLDQAVQGIPYHQVILLIAVVIIALVCSYTSVTVHEPSRGEFDRVDGTERSPPS
jgi:hypothetical protein